jgi:protoporphyrinogen IX oxidase
MLLFLTLHIMAIALWAAILLYLPTLVVGGLPVRVNEYPASQAGDSLARFLFTRVATPIALVAIISGTMVFLILRITAAWLIIKLTLVTLLAVCHALTGLLIMRTEADKVRRPRAWWWALASAESLLMLGIVWLVLAKPTWELADES